MFATAAFLNENKIENDQEMKCYCQNHYLFSAYFSIEWQQPDYIWWQLLQLNISATNQRYLRVFPDSAVVEDVVEYDVDVRALRHLVATHLHGLRGYTLDEGHGRVNAQRLLHHQGEILKPR